MFRPVLGLVAALSVAGAAQAQDKPGAVSVEFRNAAGQPAGKAILTEGPKGVLLRVEAHGLTPGWHGLHFHETGDCSRADFTSAGGHVHGGGTRLHGLLNASNNEAGDLPNLHADAQGAAAGEFYTTSVSLKRVGDRPALADKDGSALVIHAGADDQKSQPIGGAGARMACGVIR